jgi:hypothetical protein
MNTYGERLQSAMQEAGFGGPGGQTRLADEIGAKSQTINQALKGGSKELSATFHVRVCMRLGVRPLWLSEGKGPRYERSGSVAALPGAAEPQHLSESRRLFLLRDASGSGATELVADDLPRDDINSAERRLMAKLRSRPAAFQAAVATLIDLADRGLT